LVSGPRPAWAFFVIIFLLRRLAYSFFGMKALISVNPKQDILLSLCSAAASVADKHLRPRCCMAESANPTLSGQKTNYNPPLRAWVAKPDQAHAVRGQKIATCSEVS